jgi:pyridoxamine 5'-phosphate oxidase
MDELREHINKLREDFTRGTLNEADVSPQPDVQFQHWLQQAVDAKVNEVQAMHLATVSLDGRPSSRIMYLREFENNNYSFYSNYNSKKSLELANNPHATLTFFWPDLERQIRIEGLVEKVSVDQSNAYFNERPYESKIGAWASNQSHKLSSREELEAKLQTIQRPPFWGGFVLQANYYEFWQGRKSRLHDRICYELTNGTWLIKRLNP